MGTCSNCGSVLSPGDAFCIGCGTRVTESPVATAPRMVPTSVESLAGVAPSVPPAPPSPGGTFAPPPAPSYQSVGVVPPTNSVPTVPASQPTPVTGWSEPQPAGVRADPGSSVPTANPRSADQLLGEAAPNTVYLGQRMQYEKERDLEEFDPLQSKRYILQLALHAALIGFIWFIGWIPIAIVGAILTYINSKLGAVFYVLVGLAWSLLMACFYWLRKIPGQISEWKYAIDDKGAAAPVVFDHIGWSLSRRSTPRDSVQLRRFNIPGQRPRDLLEVRQGVFYGLISCLANGNDLYIGWTFWVYMSPARYLWVAIQRLVQSLRARGHALYIVVMVDRAKALREAIHSAVREGVDVAAGTVEAYGRGTIGTTIPIVDSEEIGPSPWMGSTPTV